MSYTINEETEEKKSKNRQEYYNANKEKINQKSLQYYYDNRETILAKQDKEKQRERNENYYDAHREAILKRRSLRFECECGCIVSLSNKSSHLKTNRHQKLLLKAKTE
jgi:hypothetical protein